MTKSNLSQHSSIQDQILAAQYGTSNETIKVKRALNQVLDDAINKANPNWQKGKEDLAQYLITSTESYNTYYDSWEDYLGALQDSVVHKLDKITPDSVANLGSVKGFLATIIKNDFNDTTKLKQEEFERSKRRTSDYQSFNQEEEGDYEDSEIMDNLMEESGEDNGPGFRNPLVMTEEKMLRDSLDAEIAKRVTDPEALKIWKLKFEDGYERVSDIQTQLAAEGVVKSANTITEWLNHIKGDIIYPWAKRNGLKVLAEALEEDYNKYHMAHR